MNKNILITGASSGVGEALAIYLSDKYNVIALARREEKMLADFQDYKNIHPYKVDVTNEIELADTLELIKNEYGHIYYIINCAGILRDGEIENFSFTDLDYSIKLNALAPIKIIKYFIKDMKNNNFGRIINLTSGAPLNCFPNFSAYSSSKAILNTLTVTFAKELNNYNIKINLMSPGPVKSEMAPNATMQPDVCFPTVDYLLDLKANDDISGKFFWLGYEVPLFPDLAGVEWLQGKGNEKLRKVL